MKTVEVGCANIDCVGKLHWLDGTVFEFDVTRFDDLRSRIQPNQTMGCFSYQLTPAVLLSQRSSCDLKIVYICKMQ